MLIGIITTLIVNEPKEYKVIEKKHSNYTYIRFFLIFVIAILCFIGVFLLSSEISIHLKNTIQTIVINQNLSNFIIELLRLSLSLIAALSVTILSIKINFVNKQVFMESYIAPLIDFFQRYGLKLALLLLVLICLYRISDIMLGVISNIFYQDLGFSKIEIASIVKTFGLIILL